ncbi:MAG: hypothetical protein ACRDRH_19470 [Pseudonocardia sp.]
MFDVAIAARCADGSAAAIHFALRETREPRRRPLSGQRDRSRSCWWRSTRPSERIADAEQRWA